ncbi:MAG: PAS domain S-box protein [Ignavibacteriota bacterium]|nr:MAG: PAS domain S-box protein [Chlorobiota bacterium]MBE7477079.1 PAS domain S-box protein [Ignavibacteriales bacterium]MBL1121281.1 PAS domain S-box protein [Ignavibacteriota bacterium]MCC7094396.1 PAS domain S-box protein [Ignavibacteriaceae bacterium]MCE7857769.1 PAS domain S-box protein [Ignavibacteria bacterium CHB3]MEB2295885.1 PAS domain S-box protein [Ignavibacteria bacterium]
MHSSGNFKNKSVLTDSGVSGRTDSNPMFGFEIFDSLPDMYFLLDIRGEILRMNAKADEYIKSSIKPKPTNFLDLIDIFNRESVNNVFFQSISFGKVGEIETKIINGDKDIDVQISFTYYKFSTEIQTRELVFAIVKDITKDKVKDIELQRFFNIVESSLNPILITDLNGKMIYVNPAFIKTSGYSKQELLGRNPRIFGSGKLPKKFWDKMWQTISGGKVWFGEVEDKKKNGEPFFTQLLISPIFDKDQNVTGYFGIHRDLSEKRTLEKQLIHTQKMESIGTLAAGVAHEVGNPLASISALVQVAERNTEDVFIKEKLALVKNQVTRISKIIKDLVDFSRPSNFELQRVNINDCLKEAVEITRVGTKAKNVIFDVKLSRELPTLPLVADQLEQVFVNIVLNAIDAINESKNDKQEKRISIESALVDDEAVITFIDSGSGIKEENLNKIFEPFFTTKTQGKGTGLGLWVSYGIIKSFQGNIEVDSKPEIGTKFTIKLPIGN